MSNDNKLKDNKNILSELAISEAERNSCKERTDREKNIFAESLKKSIGNEMKAVLLEKKAEEQKLPQKNIIKKFFERLRKTCQ